MKFIKMHGCGNDYVYVDCFKEQVDDPESLAKRVSDRHKGIGSDGLVLIMPSTHCDFRMRMFNSDGSEAQMCGNASRCIGKYVYDYGLTNKTSLTLETKAGVKHLRLVVENGKVSRVCVDMGAPILNPPDIPVSFHIKDVIDIPVDFSAGRFRITCVSMGNPHTVSFCDDIDNLNIAKAGKSVETHFLFPERTNAEFVRVVSRTEAFMRVWERGAGETQACGTGACATLVAAVLTNKMERKALIHLLGGDLEIEWNEKDNHVYMTGDAVIVFEGDLFI